MSNLESELFSKYNVGATTPKNSLAFLQDESNAPLITLKWQTITRLFNNPIIRSGVETPIFDALRCGYDLNIGLEGDENDRNVLDRIIKRKDIVRTIKRALTYARLYGGAGIIIENGDINTSKPLTIKKGQQLSFMAVDRWRLWNDFNAPREPQDYDDLMVGAGSDEKDQYIINNCVYHPSRIIRLIGDDPLYWGGRLVNFWGMSILEKAKVAMNQWIQIQDVILELIKAAKIDYVALADFERMTTTDEGMRNLNKTIEIMLTARNHKGLMTMPAGSEFGQKQLTYSGLDEMCRVFRQSLSQAWEIPETRLFGFAATGLNSSNEEMNDNYAQMLEARVLPQANKALYELTRLESQAYFGYAPDDLDISFVSPSYETKSEAMLNKTTELNNYIALFQNGIIGKEGLVKSINAAKLVSQKIELSQSADILQKYENSRADYTK